jgi:subtilisin-like proprotein convertase family protein
MRALALALLGLSGCLLDLPDPNLTNTFACKRDGDCVDGYFCVDGYCSSDEPEPLPDLSAIITDYDEDTGDVYMTVYNVGAADAGTFAVDLYCDHSQNDPPVDVGAGEWSVQVTSLAAGASRELVATDSPCGDTSLIYVKVDTSDEVRERSESNNLALPHGRFGDAACACRSMYTNHSAEWNVAIPDDGSPVELTADTTGSTYAVPEITVTLNISHPDVSQLLIEIEAPGAGARVTLIDGFGLSGANFIHTTLLNDAPAQELVAPYTGIFPPLEETGGVPEGLWILRVTDLTPGDRGTVDFFSVNLTEAF